MRRAYLILAAALAPIAAGGIGSGCGTDIVVVTPPQKGDGGEGGFIFLDGGGGTTQPAGGAPNDGGLPDYDDPGCKDQPPPIEDFTCDPYDQLNGDCSPGEGCYIYVDYPSTPCGQEVYGSFCAAAGTGQQGAPCGGGQDCAPSHVCVITGSGTQCVELCPLSGQDGCPPGLVCEPIDVEGFGGCL
jgi:hypothetical protein